MEHISTASKAPRAQSSIRSFFQPRQSNYVPPPSSANSKASGDDKMPTLSAPPLYRSTSLKSQEGPEVKPRAAKTSLPPQATISPIRENHIQSLRRINTLLLPINYPDSFYQKIIDPQTPNFSRVILWRDPPSLKSVFLTGSDPKVVGGIVCRLEQEANTKFSSIYIQSLALLSPYRSYGLATAILDDIIKELVKTPIAKFLVTSIYAHVWTENTEGLEWYTARGFTRQEPVVQGYYRRLQPGNAWVMRRSLVPSDHLRHSSTQTDPSSPKESLIMSPSTLPSPASSSAPAITLPLTVPTPLSNGIDFIPVTVARAASFQTTGPGFEWNDIPNEILTGIGVGKPQIPDPTTQIRSAGHLKPKNTTSAGISDNSSAASSRSSSSTRNGGKKKRQYPAAAFNTAAGSD